jgi:hypothetical protein
MVRAIDRTVVQAGKVAELVHLAGNAGDMSRNVDLVGSLSNSRYAERIVVLVVVLCHNRSPPLPGMPMNPVGYIVVMVANALKILLKFSCDSCTVDRVNTRDRMKPAWCLFVEHFEITSVR